MPKFPRLVNAKFLDNRLLSLDQKSPQATLILASIIAGLGYLLLALFPLLTLIGISVIARGVGGAGSLGAWLHLFIWLLITAGCGLITFSQLRLKASIPSGLGLKDDKAPRLYELLGELRENFKKPKIQRLVIHDKFTIEIISVPRIGLPFLSTNVLYIGLPVLQCLSPSLFRGALAGRLGQHTAEQSKKTHWIYHCVQFFSQCQHALRRKTGVYTPLKLFYRLYTPALRYFSAAAVRQDKLEADIYMLEIMNDREVADMILRYEVSASFIQNKYWPKVTSLLRKNPANPEYLPHANMSKVMRNNLTENEFAQTMNDLINQEAKWRDSKPGLHARLNNIGQTKLDIPPPIMETAAHRYLGEAFSAVVKLLDKQWQAKFSKGASRAKKNNSQSRDGLTASNSQPQAAAEEPAQESYVLESNLPPPLDPIAHDSQAEVSADGADVTIAERQRLARLKQKAGAGLDDNEAWELAHLTEKLEDKATAISLYQQALKQNPNHAKTLFAIGRILLTRNDATGVKIMERAMELDKGCIAQGCWMLAKFFKNAGNDELSRKYLERAASISVAA